MKNVFSPPQPCVVRFSRGLAHGEIVAAGARIHYQTRGSGPLLLLLPGGDGDADTYHDLAVQLEPDFTVVTYDRRGLSRSTLAAEPATVTTHADDAAAVLAALTDEPASVFGSSIGAIIALELTIRHPDAVRVAVTHEPPVAVLLPEPTRSELLQAQQDVEDTYRHAGVGAAMARFARMIELDPTDREPGAEPVRPGPERAANLAYFLNYDTPAVRQYQPDEYALRQQADKIVPAVGSATTGIVPQCAAALAQLLDVEAAVFPGGHTSPTMRPRAVADTLRALLH